MSSKRKSKSNRTRLRLLTPIKEVSGLVPVEIIPYGSKTVGISDPIKPILVKALPAESPRDVRLKERAPNVNAPNVNGPVDNIVEDYLTQARQSNIIPSPYSFGTRYSDLRGDRGLLCPCCANRNRESFEKKAALQRGKDISSIRVLTLTLTLTMSSYSSLNLRRPLITPSLFHCILHYPTHGMWITCRTIQPTRITVLT
ncbi:hypothetical protein BgiMline_025383 [Biomphalaria glabrata]|nr:hypothetical protein BgiMline_021484 [Biomphalaria glabrata]